jgi:hypothetical protein
LDTHFQTLREFAAIATSSELRDLETLVSSG